MSFNIKTYNSKGLKVKIFEHSISNDIRGNIWTSFSSENFDCHLPDNLKFKHDKFSQSSKNVLRGIHGDAKSWKLVTCVFGSIFQVVIDLREGSDSYRKYESFKIDSECPISILIPPGMGNAYYVESDKAVYHYKLAYEGEYIDADQQFSVKWDDPKINIEWPTNQPLLSERDK